MDNKNLKTSTIDQLKTLVYYMKEMPDFSRGTPVFGVTKFSTEEEWKNLTKNFNSVSPPMRTVTEWEKTWADMKYRTKKKIVENQKSTFAPQSKGNFIPLLVETPPSTNKAVAVVTPNRQQQHTTENPTERESHPQPIDRQVPKSSKAKHSQVFQGVSDDEQPACFSAKKKKTTADEQFSLLRRQLRVAEQNAATAKEQVDVAKRLADAAETQAEYVKRIAEAQAACMMSIQQTTMRIEKVLKSYLPKPQP